MTSNVKLYLNCKILKDKNFIVDDIDLYLNTLQSLELNNFQYIKHALNIEIKVDMSQEYGEYIPENDFNYCQIENEKGIIVYYFITGHKWRGESTILFELKMDTLNTFRNRYQLGHDNLIARMHKDRYEREKVREYDPQFTSVSSLVRGKYYFASSPSTLTIDVFTLSSANGIIVILNEQNEKTDYFEGQWEINFDDIKRYLYIYIWEDGERNLMRLIPYNSLNQARVCFMSRSAYTSSGMTSVLRHIGGEVSLQTYLIRNIDVNSEGLSPVKYGEDVETLEDDSSDWFLLYKAHSPFDPESPDKFIYNNSIDVYIIPQHQKQLEVLSTNPTINVSSLVEGQRYYMTRGEYRDPECFDSVVNDIIFIDSNGINHKVSSQKWLNSTIPQCLMFYKESNAIKWGVYQIDTFGYLKQKTPIDEGTTQYLSFVQSRVRYSHHTGTEQIPVSPIGRTGQFNIVDWISGTEQAHICQPLSSIDRTNSQLMKIIKLPYSPVEDFFSCEYDASYNAMKLDLLSEGFKRTINFDCEYNPFNERFVKKTPSILDMRNEDNESKLFHSDYYSPKVIYDSFTYGIQLELLNNKEICKTFNVDYVVSNTTNSRFLFAFPQYETKYQLQDFKVLPIARNNEIPIFNNYYLNYLRNGFNYDVKNKERQERVSIGMTSLQAVGSIASFIGGAVSGNPLLAVSGIGLGVSTASSIIGVVNQSASAEASIQQKLLQAQNQSASVSGSDDVDLMSYYSNNRIKVMIYRISENMRQNLFKLFHLCGYICNYKGDFETDSRVWFNFIQGNPQIIATDNISDELVEDIVTHYQEGITYLHNNFIEGVREWDFEQLRENWETFLIL